MLYWQNIQNKGKGVFSDTPIMKGDVIEICPVLPLSRSDAAIASTTNIDNYMIIWDDGSRCLAFGYCMLYNHSGDPNARFEEDSENQTLTLIALRAIPADEEICFDYTGKGRDLIFSDEQWLFADTMEPYVV